MEQPYLCTKDVAALLGTSYFRVWYAANKGRIKPLKVGHSTLFTATDIDTLRRLLCPQEQGAK